MRSIKQKILLVTLLPTSLLLTVLSGYLILHRFSAIDEGIIERGQTIAARIAETSRQDFIAANYAALSTRATAVLSEYPIVNRVQIITISGLKAAEIARDDFSERQNQEFSAPILLELSEATSSIAGAHNPSKDGEVKLSTPIGLVRISIRADIGDASKVEAISGSLLISLAGLAILSLLATLAATQLAQPIEELTEAARNFRSGFTHVRVHEDQTGEIGELQAVFNSMAEQIVYANKRMQLAVDQATDRLNKSLAELEHKNLDISKARNKALEASRSKSLFLANMSHEIRTPMNGIMGFTQLLGKTVLNSRQREYLDTINVSAENLLAIINDILDLSKLEAGKLVLNNEAFSLSQCIDGVSGLLAPMAHARKIELATHIYGDVPDSLVGDPTRIRQIVTNLVNNAIKFTPKGFVTLDVSLNEDGYDRVKLALEVTDSGIGIAEQDQERVFDTFFQVGSKASQQVGGTGLGLTITRKLVNAMKGNINLQSTPGKGSLFRVEIEVAKNMQALTANPPRVAKPVQIALLEPFEFSRRAISQKLHELGCTVIVLGDLDEYIRISSTASEMPRLALVALNSSEIDDAAFNATLSEQMRKQLLPTALLISSSDQEVCDNYLNSGAKACRPKPIRIETLAEMIDQAMGERSVAAQNCPHPEHISRPACTTLAGKRVLGADDNQINLTLLRHILEQQQAIPVLVEDGAAALEAATSDFDLIILDIHMPNMDGFQAADAIRKKLSPCPPIIALTADAMKESMSTITKRGFDGCLSKPIKESKLLVLFEEITSKATPQVSQPEQTQLSSAARYNIRNIELALEIAGGSRAVADKMFADFTATLPQALAEIDSLQQQPDWQVLWQKVHKLHGSVAVCGLPLMLETVEYLQQAINQQDSDNLRFGMLELHRLAAML